MNNDNLGGYNELYNHKHCYLRCKDFRVLTLI